MATQIDYKVTIGRQVRDRLMRNPTVFKIPSNELDIFVAREFLTPPECAALMKLIDAERIPSQLLAPTPDPEFRTSESCNLSPFEPIVKQLEDRINELLGIDPRLTIKSVLYSTPAGFVAAFAAGLLAWKRAFKCHSRASAKW